MDIGNLVLIVACILGGVALLIVLIWAIVAIVGLSFARKAAKDINANFDRDWRR